ncbi:MAG: phosphatidylserine decarboxylase [Desulfatitalea sp.]|nr:phosphatidylserine decarboxylase [Desulfatitalea sp.]
MAICVAITVCIISGFVFWRFFFFLRNPVRHIPVGDKIVTSAADGYVCYIKHVKNGEVPIAIKGKNSIALSEFLSFKERKNKSGYLKGKGIVGERHYLFARLIFSMIFIKETFKRRFFLKDKKTASFILKMIGVMWIKKKIKISSILFFVDYFEFAQKMPDHNDKIVDGDQ